MLSTRSLLRVGRIASHLNPVTTTSMSGRAAAAIHTSTTAASAASGSSGSYTAPVQPKSGFGPLQYATAKDMYHHMLDLTRSSTGKSVTLRNFVGTIQDMSTEASYTVETELFPAEAMKFYTRHNLLQTDRVGSKTDAALYTKYYNAARGGGQGDYRHLISEKLITEISRHQTSGFDCSVSDRRHYFRFKSDSVAFAYGRIEMFARITFLHRTGTE